jgi:hypothetical protein
MPHLVINGTVTPEFKYVRDVAPNPDGEYNDPNGYNGKEAPVYGEFDTKYMTDVRCGRDAFKTGAAKTETAVLEAGIEVGFRIKASFIFYAVCVGTTPLNTHLWDGGLIGVFTVMQEFADPQFNNGIFHPGPAQVYMSKSEDLKNDEGDGDWFKIYYLGPSSDTTWATDRQTQVRSSYTHLLAPPR